MTAPSAADTLHAPAETLHRRALPGADLRAALAGVGGRAQTVVGTLGLAGMVVVMGLMATGAVATPELVQAGHASIPGWMSGILPAGISLGRGVFSQLLLVFIGCWALVLVAGPRLPWRLALGGIVVLNAVALLAPPMLSTDVFNYIDYGRLGVVHGINPYQHGPIAAPFDPVFHWTGPLWIHTPTVYGPLFTLLAYAVTPLGVAGSLWAFKAIAALAAIGIVLCVAGAARAWGRDPVRPALAVGANPLLVIYAVAGAHNDLVMAFGLALGILFIARGREAIGVGSALVGAAVKASGVVTAPFLILGARRRLRAALVAAGIGGVLAVGTFVLFGSSPFDIGTVLARHERIGEYASIPGWIATRLGVPIPGHHGRAVLQGVIVAVVALCFVVAVVRRRAWLSAGAVAALAVLVLSTSFYPWYLALALPLAALAPSRIVRLSGPAVTALVILMRTGHWLFGWSAAHQQHIHHVLGHIA
jgi:alpha-1,6-mannosyltransferase